MHPNPNPNPFYRMNPSNTMNPNTMNPNTMNPNTMNPNTMNQSNIMNPNTNTSRKEFLEMLMVLKYESDTLHKWVSSTKKEVNIINWCLLC